MKYILFFISFSFSTQANTLDDLLQKVKEERALQTKELQNREARFKNQKTKQQILLNTALKELQKQEQISQQLNTEFEKNEKALSILEAELRSATGVLGELFGVVKQTTGELKGQVLHSLVSAQIPNRHKWLEALATRKKLPNTKELRRLWFELQREITELGKVTQFSTEVISPQGERTTRLVTRVGGFNIISQGRYLSYMDENNTSVLRDLSRQPKRRFTRTIKKLENLPSGHSFFALDPTKGRLISIMIRSPSLLERIKQGGLVGLIIICVFIFGMILVIRSWLILKKENLSILSQLKNPLNPKQDNPIGQILTIYEQNKHIDMETLELRLNEVVIKYLPRLERGIGTIKILSVLSPLLGLLGTVIGMIITFQSITLYGTGDPKLMAGGISQALITTVLGLCCAIPLLLCHNIISAKAKHLIQILEEQTAGLLARQMEKNNKQ